MQKIQTLFVRDEADRRYVTDAVAPGCEWVLAGEGAATRKIDGTCMRFDGFEWWARREVKADKQPPTGWVQIGEVDPVTGKRVGWELAGQSSFAALWREAVANGPRRSARFEPGTYELCGPKVNRNPEGFSTHVLIAHADAEVLLDEAGGGSRLPEWIVKTVRRQGELGWEGLVWHHPDGRMVKLKARDLRP